MLRIVGGAPILGYVLERAGDGSFEYVLHDGTAPTRLQWHFRGSSQLPVAVQSWTLPPGGSEGMHRHPADAPLEELYLVVSGTVTTRVDDTDHELGPGDAVLAPVGVDHDVRNTGDGAAHLVVVWGEPGTAVDWARFGSGRAAHEAGRPRTE